VEDGEPLVNKLVLIGHKLDRKALEGVFHACLASE